MNWNIPPPLHVVLVDVARLADEKELPESKRVAELSRVRFRILVSFCFCPIRLILFVRF